jgi:16S rRNA (adenine1518-N6/adenine1519-N6)-dimethyltransferase
MPQIDLTSPTQLKDLLRRHNLRPKKRFGQNFLVDRNIIDKIVDAMEISEGDSVLEIGPGVGTLTLALADRGANVVAVELDRDMVEVLHEVAGSYPNIKIVSQDFVRIDLCAFLTEQFGDRPVKAVGNLPYNITTPIITALFSAGSRLERIVMMIQKEVAERIDSKPGCRAYGSMSVFVQYHAETEIIADVPPTVFVPSPEVASAVVRLIPRLSPPVDIPSEQLFFDVVHSAFGRRRKTLLNSLAECPPLSLGKDAVQRVLGRAEIDSMRRAETLSLEEFARIARSVAAEAELSTKENPHAGTNSK